MDISVVDDQDVVSDYGSDFTPDEEDILNGLLHQSPTGPDPDVNLLLADIEDDERLQTARVPPRRFGQKNSGENKIPVWQSYANSRKTSTELGGYLRSSTTSKIVNIL